MQADAADHFLQHEAIVPLRRRLAFVWGYLRVHPSSLALGILGMVGRDGVAFIIPLLIRSGIQAITGARSNAHFQTDVIWTGVSIIVVALARSGFQTLARLTLIGASRNVEYFSRTPMR